MKPGKIPFVLLAMTITHLTASVLEIEQFSLSGSQYNIKALCNTGDSIWAGSSLGITIVKNETPVFHATTANKLKCSLVEDMCSDGRVVWVCSKNLGGLSLEINRSLSRFENGKWDHWNRSELLNGRALHSMAVDKNGVCWIGTRSGVYRFDGEKVTLHGMSGDIKALVVDDSSNLWSCSQRGILKTKILTEPQYDTFYVETMDGDSMTVNETYLSHIKWVDLSSILGSEQSEFQSMIVDKNDNVWVLTYSSVFRSNASLDEWSSFRLAGPGVLLDIFEADNIYISTTEGMASISHTGNELALESGSPRGVPSMLTANGKIYVATSKGLCIKQGLSYLPVDLNVTDLNVEAGLRSFFQNSNGETCFGHYTFRSGQWIKDDKDSGRVLYDKSGEAWFYGSGLLWSGSAQNKKNTLNVGQNYEIKALPDSTVVAFTPNKVWEFSGSTWSEITASISLPNYKDVALTENKSLWVIGSGNEDNLAQRNSNGEWVIHTIPDHVKCLTVYGDSLWAGGYRLHCLHEGNREEFVFPESAKASSMAADTNGNVWVATALHGVCKFENGKLEIFRTDDGIAENVLDELHVNDSDIWLRGGYSITRIGLEDVTTRIGSGYPKVRPRNPHQSEAFSSQFRVYNLKGQSLFKHSPKKNNLRLPASGFYLKEDPEKKAARDKTILVR